MKPDMQQVTAVITTFNRAKDLRDSLGKLLAQTRVPDEIWVIDDASTDDTQAMIQREFPAIRYLKLPKNVGIIRARNLALADIKDGYLLLLDDDSWFVERDGLAQCIAFAMGSPEANIFALNVLTVDGNRHFPNGATPHPVRSFQGCAALFEMKSISRHQIFFEEALERQGEEKDLCLRAYDCGLSVCAIPDIEVFHAVSNAGRNWSSIRFFEHRNDVLRELLRCPTELLFVKLLRTWAAHTRYNLRHGYWYTDLRVATALPWMFNQASRLRSPVSRNAYSLWGSLESGSKKKKITGTHKQFGVRI